MLTKRGGLFSLLGAVSLDEPNSGLGLRAVLDEGNALAVPVPGQEHLTWSLGQGGS